MNTERLNAMFAKTVEKTTVPFSIENNNGVLKVNGCPWQYRKVYAYFHESGGKIIGYTDKGYATFEYNEELANEATEYVHMIMDYNNNCKSDKDKIYLGGSRRK